MTKTKCCDYLSEPTKSGKMYKVWNIYDEELIYHVPKEDVTRINNKTDEDPCMISIVLAIIEISRNETFGKNNRRGKIEREIKIDAISLILQKFTADEVINLFNELKFYEISEILKDEEPQYKFKEVLEELQ